MLKVHPAGVIWVSNSSEILPVDSKNGSEGQKFKKNKKIHRAEHSGIQKLTVKTYFHTLGGD